MGFLLRAFLVCTCYCGICKHLGALESERQTGENSARLPTPETSARLQEEKLRVSAHLQGLTGMVN